MERRFLPVMYVGVATILFVSSLVLHAFRSARTVRVLLSLACLTGVVYMLLNYVLLNSAMSSEATCRYYNIAVQIMYVLTHMFIVCAVVEYTKLVSMEAHSAKLALQLATVFYSCVACTAVIVSLEKGTLDEQTFCAETVGAGYGMASMIISLVWMMLLNGRIFSHTFFSLGVPIPYLILYTLGCCGIFGMTFMLHTQLGNVTFLVLYRVLLMVVTVGSILGLMFSARTDILVDTWCAVSQEELAMKPRESSVTIEDV